MNNRAKTAEVPERRNANFFVWAQSLQYLADQLVSAKTVLPWLLHLAGVPAALVGLLVPIREAGSLLPQAPLTPWITSHVTRKNLWVLSSIGQALCGAAIALCALYFRGATLGFLVLVLLAMFALCRAVSSLAGKDIQGRTISKGRRGLVSGRATQIGGAITLGVGATLAWTNNTSAPILIALVLTGAVMWLFAAGIFAQILEPEAPVYSLRASRWWRDTWELFSTDREFRMFVMVRTLMLVTALSTAFIVLLSNSATGNLATLGGFVLASGLAAMVGGRVSGLLSDISSRLVMTYASFFSSVVILGLVAAAHFLPEQANRWLIPLGFFLVSLLHTAIRVARKTYIVDMAQDDNRTRYVGAANSLMGINLLLIGGLTSLIALTGTSGALLFLAAVGFAGSLMSRQLSEVSSQKK